MDSPVASRFSEIHLVQHLQPVLHLLAFLRLQCRHDGDRVIRRNDYYEPGGWLWNSNSDIKEPHNIYWPIPQSAITANTMGSIYKNYGYSGYENNVAPLETIEE